MLSCKWGCSCPCWYLADVFSWAAAVSSLPHSCIINNLLPLRLTGGNESRRNALKLASALPKVRSPQRDNAFLSYLRTSCDAEQWSSLGHACTKHTLDGHFTNARLDLFTWEGISASQPVMGPAFPRLTHTVNIQHLLDSCDRADEILIWSSVESPRAKTEVPRCWFSAPWGTDLGVSSCSQLLKDTQNDKRKYCWRHF